MLWQQPMADIQIRQVEHKKNLWVFEVEIIEGVSRTVHSVTLSDEFLQKLTKGNCTPKQCVRSAFEFLLDREEKESILSEFDLSIISNYFPDFQKKFSDYAPKNKKKS